MKCEIKIFAAIIKSIGDKVYLADYNGVKCTAIFSFFVGRYYVENVCGVQADGE